MKCWMGIGFCFLAYGTFAQTDAEVSVVPPQRKYDSIRAINIKPYPDHFFVWPVLKQRRLDFEMEDLPARDRKIAYRSNRPYGFGMGVYLFEVAAELTFSIPVDEKQKDLYGESKARDLQLNILGKQWGLDVYSQKYQGFYIDDPSAKVPAGRPYPQRPDITTRNLGFTGNYVFNNKRFSFRSAYNFADRQLHSAGSFLLFTSISSFKAQGDSAILGKHYVSEFGGDSGIEQIKSTTFAIAPGYTYSFIQRGFFLNGTLAVGPAHNWLYYRLENGGTKNDIKFSAFIVARIAMGYSGDRFFGGLSFVTQNSTAQFDHVKLTSSTGTFKILFGYRFKEFGVLKKRVRDLPKALGFGS